LIESERKKQRLNQSIVSKIFRSLLAQQKKPPTGSTAYHRWKPTAELTEEHTTKPEGSGDPSSNPYSIWKEQVDRSNSAASSSSTSSAGDAYQQISDLQPALSTGSVYSTFSDSTSPYATWQDGDKSKDKK